MVRRRFGSHVFFSFVFAFVNFLALKWPTIWCQNWVRHKVRQSEAHPGCDVDFLNFFFQILWYFFRQDRGKLGVPQGIFLGGLK